MHLIIISDCSLNNKQVEKPWSKHEKFYIQESSWREYGYKKIKKSNITKLLIEKKLFIII